MNTESTDWGTDKVNNIIEQFVQFRSTVRRESLSKDKKNVVLLSACDQARIALSKHDIVVKVSIYIKFCNPLFVCFIVDMFSGW